MQEYQRSHHEADIAACLDDRSAFSDTDLALPSKEEFLDQARDQWRGHMDDAQQHAFNIARLKNEQSTRQALQSGLHKAKARKAEVTAIVAQKRRFLESLTSEVTRLRGAGGTLWGMLAIAPQGTPLPSGCRELSLPLFILVAHVAGASSQTKESATVVASVVDGPLPPSDYPDGAQPCADGDVADMTDNTTVDVRQDDEEEGALPDATPADAPAVTAAEGPPEASSDSEGSEACDIAVDSEAGGKDAVDGVAVRLTVGHSETMQLSFLLTYVPRRHVILTAGENTQSLQALSHLSAAEEKSKSRHSSKTSTSLNAASTPAVKQVYRWAQSLGGIDFVAAPNPEDSRATVATADGNVLAGLAEYRNTGRVQKIIDQLSAAHQAVANSISK